MTEQEMLNLRNQLVATAGAIQTNLNAIESKNQDAIEAEDEMQTVKQSLMLDVMNQRFEINNKLMYTNDDQRKAALQIALDAHEDYQNLKSSRAVKIVEKVLLESEVEYKRKEFRANELLMLYYANNPTI